MNGLNISGGLRRRVERPAAVLLRTLLASAAILLLSSPARPAQASPPQRIVSLNVCTDQILLDLVAHARIAAVTQLAKDPLSAAHPERAADVPAIRGTAEDVLARDPDLVIAGEYSTPATVSILRRIGRRVVTVPQPTTMAGVRALIRSMADLVEDPAAGAALIATMDRRIAAASASAAQNSPPVRPRALVYQVNNYVSASGSLIAEALGLAGLDNAAAGMRFARGGQVSLETIVANPPDILVLASGPTTYRTVVADNLRHPALARLEATRPTVVVHWPLWLCGTQHIAEAVEMLAEIGRGQRRE